MMLRAQDEETKVLREVVTIEVEAALARGHKISHIGYAVGDPSFVTKLRNGHPYRFATLNRMYDILTRERQAYETATGNQPTASVLT